MNTSKPASRPRWSTLDDLRLVLRRRWERGELLGEVAEGNWQPLRLPLKAPTARELATDFGAVQDWSDRLQREAAGRGVSPAFRLERRAIGGRLVGANDVPAAAWFDDPEQVWRLLRVESEVAAFITVLATSAAADAASARGAQPTDQGPTTLGTAAAGHDGTAPPADGRAERDASAPQADPPAGRAAVGGGNVSGGGALAKWVRDHPMRALSQATDWSAILATVGWLESCLGSGAYLRQIDVPGVDTKFIENNRALLADLLDAIDPLAADRTRSAGKDFAQRYGFSDKPAMTRVRALDRSALFIGPGGAGVTDAVVRVDELATVELTASRVLVVENEVTYLALPHVDDAVAFFGSGYDVLRLGRLPWLHDRDVVYWGDLDTDGFVILDRLRGFLPRVRSLLMDADTLSTHQSQWTTDPRPTRVELERLTLNEHAVFRLLRDNTLGTSVRLEQERVAFPRVRAALDALWA